MTLDKPSYLLGKSSSAKDIVLDAPYKDGELFAAEENGTYLAGSFENQEGDKTLSGMTSFKVDVPVDRPYEDGELFVAKENGTYTAKDYVDYKGRTLEGMSKFIVDLNIDKPYKDGEEFAAKKNGTYKVEDYTDKDGEDLAGMSEFTVDVTIDTPYEEVEGTVKEAVFKKNGEYKAEDYINVEKEQLEGFKNVKVQVPIYTPYKKDPDTGVKTKFIIEDNGTYEATDYYPQRLADPLAGFKDVTVDLPIDKPYEINEETGALEPAKPFKSIGTYDAADYFDENGRVLRGFSEIEVGKQDAIIDKPHLENPETGEFDLVNFETNGTYEPKDYVDEEGETLEGFGEIVIDLPIDKPYKVNAETSAVEEVKFEKNGSYNAEDYIAADERTLEGIKSFTVDEPLDKPYKDGVEFTAEKNGTYKTEDYTAEDGRTLEGMTELTVDLPIDEPYLDGEKHVFEKNGTEEPATYTDADGRTLEGFGKIVIDLPIDKPYVKNDDGEYEEAPKFTDGIYKAEDYYDAEGRTLEGFASVDVAGSIIDKPHVVNEETGEIEEADKFTDGNYKAEDYVDAEGKQLDGFSEVDVKGSNIGAPDFGPYTDIIPIQRDEDIPADPGWHFSKVVEAKNYRDEEGKVFDGLDGFRVNYMAPELDVDKNGTYDTEEWHGMPASPYLLGYSKINVNLPLDKPHVLKDDEPVEADPFTGGTYKAEDYVDAEGNILEGFTEVTVKGANIGPTYNPIYVDRTNTTATTAGAPARKMTLKAEDYVGKDLKELDGLDDVELNLTLVKGYVTQNGELTVPDEYTLGFDKVAVNVPIDEPYVSIAGERTPITDDDIKKVNFEENGTYEAKDYFGTQEIAGDPRYHFVSALKGFSKVTVDVPLDIPYGADGAPVWFEEDGVYEAKDYFDANGRPLKGFTKIPIYIPVSSAYVRDPETGELKPLEAFKEEGTYKAEDFLDADGRPLKGFSEFTIDIPVSKPYILNPETGELEPLPAFTENGTYKAEDYLDADGNPLKGFDEVTIDAAGTLDTPHVINPSTGEIEELPAFTSNGTYEAKDYVDAEGNPLDGFDKVTFQAKTTALLVNENNKVFNASMHNVTGFHKVTVAIPMETKEITENGTYTPSTGKGGFSEVTVDVKPTTTSLDVDGYNKTYSAADYDVDGFDTVTTTELSKKVGIPRSPVSGGTPAIFKNNGVYYAKDYQNWLYSTTTLDGFSQVTVQVTPNLLQDAEITSNGQYAAYQWDPACEGFGVVKVNVPSKVLTNGYITSNGVHTPVEGIDGYAQVTVDVQPDLETKTITSNGTYTPSEGKDGFGEITVNVSASAYPYSGYALFSYNTELEEVDLGDLTWIAKGLVDCDRMFYGCTNLRKVTIPDSVAPYNPSHTACTLGNECASSSGSSGMNGWMFENTPCLEYLEAPCMNDMPYSTAQRLGSWSWSNNPSFRRLRKLYLPRQVNTSFANSMAPSLVNLEEIVAKPYKNDFFVFTGSDVSLPRLSRFYWRFEDTGLWTAATGTKEIDMREWGWVEGMGDLHHEVYAPDQEVTSENYDVRKNKPLWWTKNFLYSRWNKDSLTEFIETIPAYNGASSTKVYNIRCYRAQGANTDAGGCGDISEETKALAASKGYTLIFEEKE